MQNFNYNMYDALIYSLCHRFEDMFEITNLESKFTITKPTKNCKKQFHYELCNYVDIKALSYDEINKIRIITY